MNQSSKRFTSMLVAVLLIIAAFVVFFDLIQPTYSDLETMKGQQISLAKQLDSEQQLVANFQQLLSKYNSDTQTQQVLAAAMPSGPDVAGALAQIYGTAAADRLAVQGIAISAPAPQVSQTTNPTVKAPGVVTFQVTAGGSYDGIKQFLADLETNIRIFDVTSMSVQPGGVSGKAGSNFFILTVTASTYYQSN